MTVSAADLPALSRLLDETAELSAAELEAWFAVLPDELRRLEAPLREMLARDDVLGGATGSLRLPRLAPADVARPGDAVGVYRLLREIGHGGMGTVWLAERADGTLKRQVALKLPRLAWGAGLSERMARERDIGAMLEHPNIARLYDAGVDDRGRPFLALEYIEGRSIDAWCATHALDVRARLRLFVQVVRAVAYAHGRLVVHRDLKPSNVLVSADGQAHLLDFGIAKLLDDSAPALTQHQTRLMTPHYASPEQLAGAPVTVQSDVYSLGVLLYELLTGALPFEGRRGTLGAIEDAILRGDAAPASTRVPDRTTARALRGEVDAIVAKAMRREARERYATADALALDIERHLAGETVSARPDSAGYRLRKVLRRHWLALSATVAVAAALAAGGALAFVQAQRAAQQSERARLATQFVTELFRASAQPRASAPALLDQGARLIQARFPNQPELQAELFGVVGRAYADLGANTAAIEFATRELKLLEADAGAGERRARTLMLLAGTSTLEGRDEDAERYATAATQALEITHDAWADAQVLLARVQLRRGKSAQAREAAARLERALQAGGRARSAAMAWVLWLQGEFAGDSLVKTDRRRQALELMRQVEGATAADSIEMQLAFAGWLTSLNRPDEAAPWRDGALAGLRSLGGTHAVRAALEEMEDWGFRCEMVLVGHAEATAAIDRLRAEVAALKLPLPAIVGAKMDWAQADCALRWGDLDEAERLMAASAPVLLEGSQSLALRLDVVALRGWVASLRGQHAQAETWLRERLALHDRIGSGAEGFVAYAWAFLAMNDVMRGDLAAAQAVLARAPVFAAVGADSDYGHEYSRVLPELRARLQLESGHPALAYEGLPALPANGIDESSTFPAYALHGEIDCARGRRAEGLATLRASIGTIGQRLGPHDAGLARIRAVAGLCALAAGRRDEAGELAAAARAALAAHASLSPWFEKPLAELERRLARR